MDSCANIFALMALLLPPLVIGVGISPHYIECDTEITQQGSQSFTWTYSNSSAADIVISEPVCLDKFGFIITKKCSTSTGQWTTLSNSSQCDYEPINDICPEGLFEIRPILSSKPILCVILSKQPVEYSKSVLCLGSNITLHDIDTYDPDKLFDHLRLAEIKTFWLPVPKNASDSNNCLVNIVNQTADQEIRHCDERHHSVCLFLPTDLAIQSVCPTNYGALIYEPNICYGIESLKEQNQDIKQLSTTEYFTKRNTIRQIFNMMQYDEDEFFELGHMSTQGKRYDLFMNVKENIKIVSNYKQSQWGKYLGVKVITDPNKHTFALFLDKVYVYEDITWLRFEDKEIINTLMSVQREEDKFNDLKIHSVKVMKNETIDVVLCHVSASLNNQAVDISEEISTIKNLRIEHDTAVRMAIRSLLSDLLKANNATISSVNSTECCLPEHLPGNSSSHWPTTIQGETSTAVELCLVIARRCVGDSLYGAMWDKVESKQLTCEQNSQPKVKTKLLFDIHQSNQSQNDPEKTMKDIKEIIGKNSTNLLPIDIFYLSRILQKIASTVIPLRSAAADQENFTKPLTSDLVSIYNNIMKDDVIKDKIEFNSTNVLLDTFERLIDEASTVPLSGVIEETHEEHRIFESINKRDGAAVRIASNLMVFVIDPNVANVTGMAFYKSKTGEAIYRGIFEGYTNSKFLYSNQSVRELLKEDDLELATFVPGTLINRLVDNISRTKNQSIADVPIPRIVIKIFSNDRLFQEDRNITDKKVYSMIVSVSIPGQNGNLSELLPLVMRKSYDNKETGNICRYWNYKTWSKDGIVLQGTSNETNLIWCGTSHLTSFAYLIGGTGIPESHRKALDVITLMGCSLSLLGIIGVFLTTLLFKKLRQKASSMVLLQFSLAIALQMVLFCFVNTHDHTSYLIANKIYWSCIALGACLQYLVLVQFCWMMIIAYLQFNKYVKVFGNLRPDWFLIKSFFIGWILPSIPVLLGVLFDRQSYIPRGSSGSEICYPTGKSLYLGLCLPVTIVILGNCMVYIAVLRNIVCGRDKSITYHGSRIARSRIRVSVLLFFLLGLSWVFGLLTIMKIWIGFSYLFSIAATLQGFVIFVNFILLDEVTRKMWKDCFFKT